MPNLNVAAILFLNVHEGKLFNAYLHILAFFSYKIWLYLPLPNAYISFPFTNISTFSNAYRAS